MKKIFTILAIISGLIGSTNAQTFRFGVGPSLSFPSKTLAKYNGLGVGLEVTGWLRFTQNFEVFGQVGYTSFMGKTIVAGIKSDPLSHIPVLFGARYKTSGVVKGRGFFIGAGVGYGAFGKDNAGLNFSPQIGLSTYNIEILGHYSTTSIGGGNFAFLGLKTFYKF